MAAAGTPLSAVTLFRPDGSAVRLGDVQAGPVVLIFLRHFM
jgi:hypothetical protein